MPFKRKLRPITSTNNRYCWKHTSIAKKLESIRFLREAIENAKPRVAEPKCCHTIAVGPTKTPEEGLKIRPSPAGVVLSDNVMAKLQAFKMTKIVKRREQFERKIEIVKRLLFEQSLKRKENPPTKLRRKIRQTSRKIIYGINKDKSSEITHRTSLLSPTTDVYVPKFDSHRSQYHSEPVSGRFLGVSKHKQILGEEYTKYSRYSESFSEKIEKGKLQFDKGWFANPSEIKFKYESNNPMAVYKKSVVITNTGRCLANCGFEEVKCNMLVHPNTFTGTREIERIYPGMTLSFDLTFCTHGEIFGDLRASAYFLTRREGLEGYIEIPVLCRPTVCDHLEPSLISTNIHFRKVNYWDKPSTQITILTNPLDAPCEVYLDSNTDELLGAFNENLRRFNKDKKTYVVDKNYGKKIKNALSKIIANYVIEYILNNIFEPIQTVPRFFTKIPRNSELPLTIKFIPQLVNKEDFIVKRINVNHVIKNKLFLRNEITIKAKTEGFPIVIEPSLLDFKVGLVGVCLQQTAFTLTNTGKIPIPLKVTAERSLKKFITIRPKCFFALSGQSTSVSVCLKIGPGFGEAANKFIDKAMRLLEFPIYIQECGGHRDKIMPLTLPAMAILTNCFALGVSEKFIDFGTVYLSTSSLRRLKIVNQSPLLQFYGFLNVPNSIIIEPGCGFGYIYPGEALDVDLIYSPSYEEIACNGRQKCIRNFITLYTALSASHFKNIKEEIAKHDTKNKKMHNTSQSKGRDSHMEEKNEGVITYEEEPNKIIEVSQHTPALLSKTTEVDEIDEAVSMEIQNPLDVSYEAVVMHFGSLIYDEKIDSVGGAVPLVPAESGKSKIIPLEESEVTSTRNESDFVEDEIQSMGTTYSMQIEYIASVVRPIMEFSSQKVLLQPTPCGSSSYASVYLREKPQDVCICGEKSEKIKFTGRFYLTTNNKSVNVQPISGNIHDNMCQKVFIEYRPTLEKEVIRQTALELQLEAEKKLLTEKNYKPSSSKKTKKASATSSSKRTPKKAVNIDETVYEEARELLLKSLDESIEKTVIINCKLQIWLQKDNSDERESDQCVLEEIECHVVCTVVKPDFILKSARDVDFGLVAEGMRKTMPVEVKNISENPIYLRLSHLNPIGSFSHSLRTLPIQCKNYRKIRGATKEIHKCSILVDPGEKHEIRVSFSSNGENVKSFERLDVEGGRTNVVLLLKAQAAARGVQFNPKIDFYKLECGFGGQQKVEVLVTSTSKASQHLSIKREYLKTIPLVILPDIFETKTAKNKSSKGQEKATPSKGKSGKHTPLNLHEEEKRFLDNYENDEKYNFEELFSLTFEAIEKVKSKKGKTESKVKNKSDKVQEVSINDAVKSTNEKNEISLQPMGKCNLISIFSLKETDKLQNSVQKLNSTKSKNDDLDSIVFYKNMAFVAKYNIVLGLNTSLLDLYFVGKVKGS